MQEMGVQSLGQEDSLEKEIATHSSILVWEIPWTEEPGGLQSIGSQRVRHDWSDLEHSALCLWVVSYSLRETWGELHYPCLVVVGRIRIPIGISGGRHLYQLGYCTYIHAYISWDKYHLQLVAPWWLNGLVMELVGDGGVTVARFQTGSWVGEDKEMDFHLDEEHKAMLFTVSESFMKKWKY